MPKVSRDKSGGSKRHDPLAEQIIQEQAAKNLRLVPKDKRGRMEKKGKLEDEELAAAGGVIMDAKTSSKLLSTIQATSCEDDNDSLQLSKVDLSGARVADEVELYDEGFVYDGINEDFDGVGLDLDPAEERAMAAFAPTDID